MQSHPAALRSWTVWSISISSLSAGKLGSNVTDHRRLCKTTRHFPTNIYSNFFCMYTHLYSSSPPFFLSLNTHSYLMTKLMPCTSAWDSIFLSYPLAGMCSIDQHLLLCTFKFYLHTNFPSACKNDCLLHPILKQKPPHVLQCPPHFRPSHPISWLFLSSPLKEPLALTLP